MAAFTDSPVRGAMLVMLNGEGGQARVECPKCRKPMLRVFVTARVRQLDPSMAPHQDVCITKEWMGRIPCLNAVKSVGLIDKLMEASRR